VRVRAARWIPAALAALLLAGCSGGPSAPSPSRGVDGTLPAPSDPPAPPDPSLAPGTPAPAPVTGRPGAPQDVATGLDVPWTVAVLPDGSALVTERDTARVLRVGADGTTRPVDAGGEGGAVPGVAPRGEGGLLGLVPSPAFADDRTLYAFTTTAQDDRVVAVVLTDPAPGEDGGGSLSAPRPVLTGIPSGQVHHGGRLAFGPDGMLYASTGEAGDPERSQDPGDLGGKVLRVTPDGEPAPGNPVAGSPVWTLGHRNVQGLGWDAQGRMYASEFGQDAADELNLLEPGRNYGWPRVEGFATSDADRERYTDPLVTWAPADASPSGLLVTGDAVYLSALRGQRLWRVPLVDGVLGEPEALLEGELGRLRDVVVGPDRSALWLLTDNTGRGDPREGDDRLVRLPLG